MEIKESGLQTATLTRLGNLSDEFFVIRRYLTSDECNFLPGEAHFPAASLGWMKSFDK
jgi:hypothetical protein